MLISFYGGLKDTDPNNCIGDIWLKASWESTSWMKHNDPDHTSFKDSNYFAVIQCVG